VEHDVVGGGADGPAGGIGFNPRGAMGPIKLGSNGTGPGTVPVNVAELDMMDGRIAGSTDKYAALSADGHVGNEDPFQCARRSFVVKAWRVVDGDGERMGSGDLAMRHVDILNRSPVLEVHGEAHVAVTDQAVVEDDIANGPDGFCSDFQGGTTAVEEAAFNEDILTHSLAGAFDDNGIIACADATIADADPAAVVGVDPVGDDPVAARDEVTAKDMDILTTQEVNGP